MPLYEYQCKKCGKRVEVIQKFSDKPLTRCESCGGSLEKLLSASGFILKGSGWYKTDYASSSGKSKKADDKADSTGEGSSTSSTDAEPSPPTPDKAGGGRKSKKEKAKA